MVALVVAAVAVGLDNFGAAIGIGLLPYAPGRRWLVASVFGLFEAAMPVLGLFAGRSLSGSLAGAAPAIGGTVVGVMGAYTLGRELWTRAIRTGAPDRAGRPGRSGPPDRAGRPGRSDLGVGRLVVLAAVLSVDNLVVGFALGTYHVAIPVAVAVIGAVSVALSLLGLELGSRLGNVIGGRSELVGGLALIVVGILVGLGVH